MLGKENAIALPAVLLLGDLLRGREPSNAEAATRRTLRYVPLLAAALAFVALRGAIVGRVTPAPELLDNPLGLMAPGPRLLTAVAVIGRYALRLVFPLWLSADYSYDQIPAVATPLDPGFLAGAAVIVTVAVLVWSSWRRAPEIALGLGMLALTFALVSNLVVPIGTIMGERLLYLPSAGFCLALAGALVRLAPASDATTTSARWPPAVMAALAVVVALYGARTVSRNTIWREPLVFFATMTRDAPRSARSHAELATALAEAGRLDEAGPSFERALAIKPEDAVVLYNWGNALGSAGRWDDAADKYQRAITAKPNFGEAFENLGGVESARGNQEAALAALDRARELTPNSPYLLMTTANVLARAGSIAAARSTYERALAERPEDPTVRRQYEEFLRAHPNATVEAER
jgi:tetratricopeptide (TPR) repeat protein